VNVCQQQPTRPQPRGPDRRAAAKRARENRRFVRALLAKKEPEFSRVLALVEQELACEVMRPPAI
jgi:hypothetical protein